MTDAKDQRMDNTYPDAQEIDDAKEVCMANRELEELLVKADDIRRSIAKLLKGELKNTRQTGPAKGQRYWIHQLLTISPYVYEGDDFDLNAGKCRELYPEERFAGADLRAMKLIQAVNKRRRELNDSKGFGERKCYIVFCSSSGVEACEESNPLHARVNAYPFGLFRDYADCETCIHKFEGELKWFYEDYLPLMEELDDYDWADAPGWGE